MNAARYDYAIKYHDSAAPLWTVLENVSRAECQQWIEDYLLPGQLLHVREISLDEYSRDVTDQFFPARDPDAARLAFHRNGIAA